MKTSLALLSITAAAVAVGGCTRVATPLDVHTQYVAKVLVTPQCLTQCDHNGDGLIQYRLWPGTETPSVEEPGAKIYGITEAHGPLSDEVAEKDKKIEQQLAADDPEENPYAEIKCWEQCRGPVMTSAAPMAEQPQHSGGESEMVPAAEVTPAQTSKETTALPY